MDEQMKDQLDPKGTKQKKKKKKRKRKKKTRSKQQQTHNLSTDYVENINGKNDGIDLLLANQPRVVP